MNNTIIPAGNSTPHAASVSYPTLPHAYTPCSYNNSCRVHLPTTSIPTSRPLGLPVRASAFICPQPTPLYPTPKTSHHPRVPTFRTFLLCHIPIVHPYTFFFGKTTELGIPRPNHDIPGYPLCTKVARAQLIGQRRFLPWFGPKRPGYTQLCHSFLQIVPSWPGPVP